jgi:hypothetical protein
MPRRLLVLSLAALSSFAASPAAHAAIDAQPLSPPSSYRAATPTVLPAPQVGQLPQATKVVTLRCTPAPAPAPPIDKHAPRPPTGPTGSSEVQVGTIAPESHDVTEIDLGPCPQERAADEPDPEPEPRGTTAPTGKPADDEGVSDAERARREQMERIRQMLDAMNRTHGGVIDGMTR